jgi:hypothetical protein
LATKKTTGKPGRADRNPAAIPSSTRPWLTTIFPFTRLNRSLGFFQALPGFTAVKQGKSAFNRPQTGIAKGFQRSRGELGDRLHKYELKMKVSYL